MKKIHDIICTFKYHFMAKNERICVINLLSWHLMSFKIFAIINNAEMNMFIFSLFLRIHSEVELSHQILGIFMKLMIHHTGLLSQGVTSVYTNISNAWDFFHLLVHLKALYSDISKKKSLQIWYLSNEILLWWFQFFMTQMPAKLEHLRIAF